MHWSKARSVSVMLASMLLTLLMVGAVSAQDGAGFSTNPFADQSRAAQPTTYINGVTFSPTSLMDSSSRAVVGLTHSTNRSTITAKNSIACNLKVGTNDVYALENSYYRTFKLSDFGVTQPLAVSAVEAGIELAKPANGATTQPVNVNLYVLSGSSTTPSINNLRSVGSARYEFPFVQNTFALMPAKALIFPEETLVVEINIPRATADGKFFYIGSNEGGETAPGYIRAPECNVNDLTTTAALARPTMHMLISVFGETTDGTSYNVLNNSDFETDINADAIPDNWIGKSLTGDKLKTNKTGKVYSYQGNSAFKFKGGANEISSISQKVDLKSYPTRTGDQLRFTGAFQASNLPAGGIVKLKVSYIDPAAPATKETFGVPLGSYEYGGYASAPISVTGSVDKVKVSIENRTPSGKFYIDTTTMVWSAIGARTVRESTFGGTPGVVNAQELQSLSGSGEALPLPAAQ